MSGRELSGGGAAAGFVPRDGGTALVGVLAAAVVGATIGVGTAAGAALLLYTGRGFLATAGFLLAVTIAALAAGVWVGAPEGVRDDASSSRRRWVWIVLAFLMAAAFTALWAAQDSLRALALGGALAVLLILAEPAYTAGTLLASLEVRVRAAGGAGAGVPALLGAAAGVLLAATTFIPRFEAPGVFLGAAVLLAVTGGIESASSPRPTKRNGDSMRDRVAIITGVGDRGQVGYAIARRFLDAGARLVISGHSDRVLELAEELARDGQVVAVRADLTDAEQAARVVDVARQRYGRLDALINVAGGLSVVRSIADTEPVEWQREIQRNADTTYQLSRASLPALRESRGAIVNFASPAGARAVANLGAYSAGKAAVIALTRALALEERPHGVRVNAIAPGLIDTEQNVAGVENPGRARFVTRDEVARVALFLAGPASSGISGETIHVMGDALH